MQETAVSQLKAVGLSEYEAGVFAALTEHSPAGAAFLAKKLGLSRSTVYTALDRLVAKGLAGTSYRNEIKQFVASPPSAIGDLLQREAHELEEKRRVFDSLAEHLTLLRKTEAAIPHIVFFEGKESLKKIYLGMLREAPRGALMRILRDEFVWKKDWAFVFSDEWNAKVRRLRSERDIKTRLLVNDSAEERAHAKYYRARKHLECRRMPKTQATDRFVIYVLGDVVSILSMEAGNLVGIRIANAHIARNFERVFDGLWAGAKRGA